MDYSNLIGQLIQHKAHRVTWYESSKKVKRVTRRLYGGKILSDKYGQEFHVHYGLPNYRERQRIKWFNKIDKASPRSIGAAYPRSTLDFQMPPKKRKK